MADDRTTDIFGVLMRQLDVLEVMIRTSLDQESDSQQPAEDGTKIAEVINVLSTAAVSIHSIQNRSNLENVSEIRMQGDSFSNVGAGAVIVNRSSLTNSLNSVERIAGVEVVAAIQEAAELVAQSANQDAAENLNALAEELQRTDPRKSLLRSFWNGIEEALPNVVRLAELGERISKLFN